MVLVESEFGGEFTWLVELNRRMFDPMTPFSSPLHPLGPRKPSLLTIHVICLGPLK